MAVEPPSLEKLRFGQPVPRHVEPLFLLCVEVIMHNGANLLQKACRMLPPSQLRYLLYRAMKSGDVTYIECLVRYWPFDTLSFDMYNFIIIDDDVDDDYLDRDYLHNGIRNYLYWIGNDDEIYLQRHHSWFCSSRYPQLQFDEAMVVAIARGVYSRIFESQSVDQATSRTKQIIIDMSMVRLENTDIPSSDLLTPLMNLCFGIHPLEQVNNYNDLPERVAICTGNSEKVVIKVSENNNLLLSFCNTTPCALISEFIWLPYINASLGINLLQALEYMTSLHFILTSSNCGVELAKILTHLKEKGSVLNEISIMDCRNLNVDFIPAVPCRRIVIETGCCTSLFNCAYHPCRNLHSLHITSKSNFKLNFDSEISKVIEHNCRSLLDLQMSGIKVAKNSVLLLQGTFQKCHALVILIIHNANDGTLASAKLHEIFCSIKNLVSLERLSVSDSVNVFGEDLCALYNLVYQGLPKLKECHLAFQQLIIYFMLLKNPKFEPIQELLAILLSGKQPSPDCHTVAFKWKNNQTVHTWLANLCRNVNFKLGLYM